MTNKVFFNWEGDTWNIPMSEAEFDARIARGVTSDEEELVCDEKRPGIELITFRGALGYSDEHLQLENGLGNGLRFVATCDRDGQCVCFNILSKKTALLLAARLAEWCERIADPPEVAARETQGK